MDILIIFKILLIILLIIIIDFIIKLAKTIYLERRISRYSIARQDESDNIGDLIKNKYNNFLHNSRNKFKKVDLLNKQSNKYNKYVMTGEKTEIIDFIKYYTK